MSMTGDYLSAADALRAGLVTEVVPHEQLLSTARAVAASIVAVLPLAVGSVIDETPGVQRSQLIQTGPAALTLRLDITPGAAPEDVWEQACSALTGYLGAQGLPGITVVRADEPPQRSPTSAKFRQVIARPAKST